MGRALPAYANHRLRGTRLPLGDRAQVLCKAVGLVERHLAAGSLLLGTPWGVVAPSSPWENTYVRACLPARSLRVATR